MALAPGGIAAGPEVWFIGDADVDMECAHAGGCVAVFIGDSPDDFQNFPPAHRFDTCDIVSDLVQRLCATISQESSSERRTWPTYRAMQNYPGSGMGPQERSQTGRLHMSEKSQNVQDVFLNHVRKNKTPVTVFLVNGVKLQGIITWFDNFSVLLRRDAHSQLVYKHAISTVMPAHPIQLFEARKEGDEHLTHPIKVMARLPRAPAARSSSTRSCEIRNPADGARSRSKPASRKPSDWRARSTWRSSMPKRSSVNRPQPATLFGSGTVEHFARPDRRPRKTAIRSIVVIDRAAVSRCSSATSNGAGRPRSSTAPA